MRDRIEFRMQGLMRLLAKPIALSATSRHVDAIVSKNGDSSSAVADSIAPRSWVCYAFLMDGILILSVSKVP